MDHQQGFIVGVSDGGRTIEAPCEHCFVVDHGIVVGDQTQAGDQAGANRQNDERFVQPCFTVVTAAQFFETIFVFESDC